ncbi:MAG: Holliday junction branch migration protein RuvA [Bacteroidota bacterium]
MIAHIEGKLVLKTPTYIVVDCSGVGYAIQISLHTYEKIKNEEHIRVLTHLSIKEDSHTLYGFADEDERQLFQLLISVNGVGTNTARMILSSLIPADIKSAISSGNWALLKTIKGIGPKTAQRIVIDLQDKIAKSDGAGGFSVSSVSKNINEEALAALMMLGFSKSEAEKGLIKIKQLNPDYTVEELVKNTLKIL